MEKQHTSSVGNARLWLIGLVATLPWVVFFAAGWEMQSPRNQVLLERVRLLESQVQELREQMGPTPTTTTQKAVIPAPTPTTTVPTPTPAYRLTPVPEGRVLVVVVVAKGNVRAGPGTNYEIIGAVEAGNTLNPIGHTASGWYQFCCVGEEPGWVGPIVVKEREPNLVTSPTRKPTRTPTKPASGVSCASPPYTKCLKANGALIMALEDVSSQALRQARDMLYGMMQDRPQLLPNLTKGGLRIILFDSRTTSLPDLPEFKAWDSAGQHAGGYLYDGTSHVVAAPEQDLRCSGILIHEIGHAVDYAAHTMYSDFQTRLDAAYQAAKAKGAWVDPYASTNKHEYWAVAVDYWFRSTNTAALLSKTDPEVTRLVSGVFGSAQLSAHPCR